MDDSDKKDKNTLQQQMQTKIGRKADRKLRARREGEPNTWFWIGMFGLVGWSIAIPAALGVLLGRWIDKLWPGPVSWTLTILLMGILIGCMNAWYWIKQESNRGR